MTKLSTQKIALSIITGLTNFEPLLTKYEVDKIYSPQLMKEFRDHFNDLIERWEVEENDDQLDYLLGEMENLLKELIPELR